MNQIKITSLIVSAALSMGAAQAQEPFDESDLYGASWTCKYEDVVYVRDQIEIEPEEDMGFKVSWEVSSTFVRNGSTNAFGSLSFEYDDFQKLDASAADKLDIPTDPPEVEYGVRAAGTWEIKDGYLIEKIEDAKYVHVYTSSEPVARGELLFENLKPVIGLLPSAFTRSSKILTLSDTRLELRDEADGKRINCSRNEANKGE